MIHTTLSSSSSLNEDSMSHSSASTAGPPPDSPRNTGRFPRNSWNLATARQYNSENEREDSLTGSYTSRNLNQTDSFKPSPFHTNSNSNNTGSFGLKPGHNRSLSNTIASVSPMGSSVQPEWGRSFRLFNLRPLTNSRQRESGSMYRSVFHGRGTSSSLETDRNGFFNMSTHQRQNSIFSSTFNGQGFSFSAAPVDLKASAIFSAGTPLPSQGVQRCSSPNLSVTHCSTSLVITPRTTHSGQINIALAEFALGGGQGFAENLSMAQRELDMTFSLLQSHLSMNGSTIIVGDKNHPLEIKRGAIIGSGGFAKVFVGLNTVKRELVAIKEIDIADIDNVSALNSVEEEFALLRSVSHPNIINYYFFEHSRSKKVCRIVMEFLAGDSTLNLLQKFGPLTETILRKLTRNLLQAIAFIHKEGIFHRDIKPANILVSHKGVVKLCDFGCSKRVEELSKASSCIIGTPVYMAPELIKGEANHKADIWSMACSLFELGTGLLPWYHSGVKDHLPLMFYITTTSETPLVLPAQDNVSEFSPEFMDFMEQSFIRDPDRRPEASELLKHPWIVGTKLPPKVSKTSALYAYLQNEKINGLTKPTRSSGGDDIDGGESSASRESAPSPPVETSASVYDEAVCQQELEVVAASISVDLCSNLMLSNDTVSRQLEQKFAEHSDYSPSNSQQSPSVSNRGPISTSVGDIGSLNVSPEVSMVHENYFYPQASFGASGGTFVLPTEGFSYGTQQQYLRINDDGNLDFATFPDDDNDIFTETYNLRSVSVDSSVLTTPQLMNHMMTPGKNSSFSRGSFLPPPTERGNTPQRMSPGHASKGESPYRTGQGSRPPPVLTNLSPSLSPSGFSNSPRISQTASLSSSARLEFPFSPRSPVSPQSSGVHPFPLKSKANAEGKLNMSFCVNTAPGQEINVDLSFDVNDVQCKMVDNQPNYVVAMTDNIKGQIANKIKEVSSRGGLSGNSSPSSVNNRTRDMPRNSTGSHFYNSPNWNSAASNNRQSVPKLRGRYSTGGIPITSGVPHSGFGDSGSSLASRCSTPAGSLTSGTPHISPRNRRN